MPWTNKNLGDFNAQIYYQGAGENSIVGPYVFGNSGALHDSHSNRSMLLELCTKFTVFFANSWFEPGLHGVVIYRFLLDRCGGGSSTTSGFCIA